jgi:TRAP-type C4-dicarboxylate transport system permease small subunit
MRFLNALHKQLLRMEDIVLIGALLITLTIAVLQIVLRNFFDSGIIWGDSFLSISVLWLGMAGAIFASRDDSHISIDLGLRFLSVKNKQIAKAIVYLFTTFICSIVAWYGANLVLMEYEDKTLAFAQIPTWLTVSIIPLGFASIALRYLILFLVILVNTPPDTDKHAGNQL